MSYQGPPQQPPWPGPPMPQPPQPRKKNRLKLILAIVGGVLVVSCAICSVIVYAASTVHTTNATPTATTRVAIVATATPTETPTKVPTKAPTTQPTAIPTSSGPALLGASLGAFVAKFGKPNQYSQPNSGMYDFSIYGNNKDDVTVFIFDGKHADSILYDSPTDAGWSESTAVAVCRAFLPPDATYKRQIIQSLDIQRVYVSPSLAQLFPASDFTDENGNQTAPGTIGMTFAYNGSSTTNFLDCGVQVGLQAN